MANYWTQRAHELEFTGMCIRTHQCRRRMIHNEGVRAASAITSGAPKGQVAPAAVTKRRNFILVKSLLTQTRIRLEISRLQLV
jgi:hypothetical protein